MALMEERGADRRLAETPRGSLLAYTLTPTIYVTIVSGHMETEHADALLAFSEARVRGREHRARWLDPNLHGSRSRRDRPEARSRWSRLDEALSLASRARGDQLRAMTEIRFTPDALAKLAKVPFFVRPFAKLKAESEARARGLTEVTAALLDELKNAQHG